MFNLKPFSLKTTKTNYYTELSKIFIIMFVLFSYILSLFHAFAIFTAIRFLKFTINVQIYNINRIYLIVSSTLLQQKYFQGKTLSNNIKYNKYLLHLYAENSLLLLYRQQY